MGFDRRVTAAGVSQLLDAAPRLVPALADCAFRDAWAGLRPCTPDRLPVVGRAPGVEGLLGEIGTVTQTLAPRGKVFVHGETWDAESDAGNVPEGGRVRVQKVDELSLVVAPEATPSVKELA